MNRILHFLVGPELFWVVYYIAVIVIIRATHSPLKSMDSFWLSMPYIIPLILLPLTFLSYYLPGAKNLLLLRLWIVGILGCHFVLNKALLAHSEQGPGVGTAYMMGLILAFIALVGCTIWAVIKF